MGKRPKKDITNSKRRHPESVPDHDDMYDEIDAFHKQRDVVPLDINADAGSSDEDYENPVFDLKGISDDEGDEDEEDDDDDDDDIDDEEITGFAARITRQQKYLKEKFGGVEDYVHDEDDSKEEEGKLGWGRKEGYYGGDNREAEMLSSDDESAEEEEAEVKRMVEEKMKYLSDEDFGLEDVNEGHLDGELTLEEISVKGKPSDNSFDRSHSADDLAMTLEVKKDLNALSEQEQMDVVYSSAPELVDLLSELNDAREQLQEKVIPLLQKAKKGLVRESLSRYLEVKQVLLLTYCQAISCYLLLKSEGRPVRDHPIIARILEIQGLSDKMNKLDQNLQLLDEIKENGHQAETPKKSDEMYVARMPSFVSKDSNKSAVDLQVEEPLNTTVLVKVAPILNQDNTGIQHKHTDKVGVQSREMLKVRAALEDKLKQKGIIGSSALKSNRGQKRAQPVNGQLETYDDFDDDALAAEGGKRGSRNGEHTMMNVTKISDLVTSNQKKPKVVSGDDDLPKRDDIGERRRKHELRVLAGAGIRSDDDATDEVADEVGSVLENGGEYQDGSEDSANEFYKQVEHQRAAKQAEKAKLYSRTPAVPPSMPELETADGKRLITTQMEKNRGLTRSRKKALKNPRKKYREKHEKKRISRLGQVQEIRKLSGQYGGETTGINAGISRSRRLKY